MERLEKDLFTDTSIEEGSHATAGAFAICATAIGGTSTRCITNPGGAISDAFLDTGP